MRRLIGWPLTAALLCRVFDHRMQLVGEHTAGSVTVRTYRCTRCGKEDGFAEFHIGTFVLVQEPS